MSTLVTVESTVRRVYVLFGDYTEEQITRQPVEAVISSSKGVVGDSGEINHVIVEVRPE